MKISCLNIMEQALDGTHANTKVKSHLRTGVNSVSVRIDDDWTSLPQAVNTPSIIAFKSRHFKYLWTNIDQDLSNHKTVVN